MNHYLPYDIARCTGFNSTSECAVRENCLRYRAKWRESHQVFIYKSDESPCSHFLEIKHDSV